VLGIKRWFPGQLKAKGTAGASGLVRLDVLILLALSRFPLPGAQNRPDLLIRRGKIPPVPPFKMKLRQITIYIHVILNGAARGEKSRRF
jgi:hypothetical protein